MTKQTEALKQALTELLWYEEAGLGRISSCDAIRAVREVLAIEAIEQPAQPQQEPVAVVSGYYGGQCVILPIDLARIFNSNTAFYTSPQPCPTCEALVRTVMLDQTSHDAQRQSRSDVKPLTDEQIWDEVKAADLDWQTGWSLDEDASNRYITFARAIEAAHQIGV